MSNTVPSNSRADQESVLGLSMLSGPTIHSDDKKGFVLFCLRAMPSGAQGFPSGWVSGQYIVPGIEPRLASCKTSALPNVLLLWIHKENFFDCSNTGNNLSNHPEKD